MAYHYENLKLEKGMYSQSGRSFAQTLEALDPSENYKGTSLEGLDAESLKARVQDVQNTLQKVSEAKTKVVGFVQGVKKVVESVSGFFDKIKDIMARF